MARQHQTRSDATKRTTAREATGRAGGAGGAGGGRQRHTTRAATRSAGGAGRGPVSDVVIIDDRDAVSYSLWAVLRWQPGIRVIGRPQTPRDALRLVTARSPLVCLLSSNFGDGQALRLADRLKRSDRTVRVIIYADRVDDRLAEAAIVAGADGVVWRYLDPEWLVQMVTAVHDDGVRLPLTQAPGPRSPVTDLVAERDRSIVGMLVARIHPDDIARLLGISAATLKARRRGILRDLDARVGASDPSGLSVAS